MPLRKIHGDARHPFERTTIAGIFFAAIVITFTDTFPNSINTIVGSPWKYTWAALLLVGASISLIGIYLKSETRGLVLEQAGMFWTGGACLVYTYALLSYNWEAGLLIAAAFGSFGASCLLRFRDIRKSLKSVTNGSLTMSHDDTGGKS